MLRKFRTGLRRSERPPQLHFRAYLQGPVLPAVPPVFGHYGLLPTRTPDNPYPIGLLGNDTLGDCTIAGPMHAAMLWNKIVGQSVRFTRLDAIDDYRDACGYIPGRPETDRGGDMASVAAYWQRTGMRDCTARRHKISAFTAIDPSHTENIYLAAHLFAAVGLGIVLPDNAEEQFDACAPWTDAAATDDEYHFVILWGRDGAGLLHVATWGADQTMTEGFLKANVREVISYVSPEAIVNGKSAEGFDLEALLADQEAAI